MPAIPPDAPVIAHRPAAPPGLVVAVRPARRRGRATPYFLMAPTLIILVVLLALPLYKIISYSMLTQGLKGRFAPHPPPPSFVGGQNFSRVVHDGFFWTVAGRTLLFAAVAVSLSIIAGLVVAQLMRRVSPWVRITMTVAMLFVWAMPQVVSTQVFEWMIDADFGVVNWLIDQIPGVNFTEHSWWVDPVQGWTVITLLVLWGALPFLAVTFYAGLTQVPRELIEAARVDGAGPWQVFRSVTLPILRPLIVIATTLSIIWDVGLFTQPFVIRNTKPELAYYTLNIYSYEQAFVRSDYFTGSAIAILTIALLACLMVFYVRQMFKIGAYES